MHNINIELAIRYRHFVDVWSDYLYIQYNPIHIPSSILFNYYDIFNFYLYFIIKTSRETLHVNTHSKSIKIKKFHAQIYTTDECLKIQKLSKRNSTNYS